MTQTRQAAVAGTFYPADPGELTTMVDAYLTKATTQEVCPKALIAPHAGYVYSGQTAAMVYARLANSADTITKVVLLGPSHRVGFNGIAASNADMFATPLGDIPIDKELVSKVVGLADTVYLDQAHAQEHSLEVHLPFLQRTLKQFTLVPLVVGQARPKQVARVLEALWGGPETLIVISSDLSHFHDYDEAVRLDKLTSDLITQRSTDLQGEQACGCKPINGLMYLARQKGLTVELVDMCNSGDTAGSKDRVVGYGSYVITEPTELSLAHRQRLLQLARNAIEHKLFNQGNFNVDLARFPAVLTRQLASFITINRHGRLRGCIGSLTAQRALVADVAHNAQAAAFNDPRFKALRAREFPDIELHISILSEPQKMNVDSREALVEALRPGVDGLIIKEAGRQATYLPSVWEQLADPDSFVAELRVKAGLSRTGWSPSTEVFRYTTEEFS